MITTLKKIGLNQMKNARQLERRRIRKLAKSCGIDLRGKSPMQLLDMLVAQGKVIDYRYYSPQKALTRHDRGALNVQKRENRPATSEKAIAEFYKSWDWKRLSYETRKERGQRCECCGATPAHGVRIVCDHIKPIRKHWHLRLDRDNLQVLCDDCNMGKGSHDDTDWRGTSEAAPVPELDQAFADAMDKPERLH
jgi:5-methylcytosine-specific restriction endonuclease McrA